MADITLEQLLVAVEESSEAVVNVDSSQQTQKNNKLEQWCDNLESQLLVGVEKSSAVNNTKSTEVILSSSSLKKAADVLHTSILSKVFPSSTIIVDSSCKDDDSGADKILDLSNSLNPTSLSVGGDDDGSSVDIYQLATLLRATGLFMRWNAQILQRVLQQSNDNIMKRLKCNGMVLLYAKLLDVDISSSLPPSCDVPRFASICLFRATYGNNTLSTTSRMQFVNELEGCVYLMKALLKGNQPVPRLFSIIRNVHHLIAACPESISKMQKALLEENDNVDNNEEGKTHGLSEVLIATLAWAYRSESDPSFPGVQSDRRSDLVLEILRALYVLGSNPAIPKPSHDTMSQIGIILCELLQFSNADERIYQIKLAVIALLLDAPKEYATYLINNGGIQPLVDIMSYQTSLVVVERTGRSEEDAAEVVPILLVLLKLVQSNKSALEMVKNEVFPPDAEDKYQQRAKDEIAKGNTEGSSNAKNMAPLDAPRDTLRWRLIRLMTWTESNVKRSTCELLYALCDADSTEFVLRTGFGNAIHFLGIRGHVNLPAGVEI